MISYKKLIAEMEFQHKELAIMLQNLKSFEGDGSNGEGSNKEVISDALDAMSKYAAKHFGIEEEAMEQTNYPMFEHHKQEHMYFLKKTANFCLKARLITDTSSSEIISYLQHWFETHIESDDQEMSLYLKKKLIDS